MSDAERTTPARSHAMPEDGLWPLGTWPADEPIPFTLSDVGWVVAR